MEKEKRERERESGIVVCFADSASLDDENVEGIAEEVFTQLQGIREGGAEVFGGLIVLPSSPDGARAFSRLVGDLAASGLLAVTSARGASIPPEQLN